MVYFIFISVVDFLVVFSVERFHTSLSRCYFIILIVGLCGYLMGVILSSVIKAFYFFSTFMPVLFSCHSALAVHVCVQYDVE